MPSKASDEGGQPGARLERAPDGPGEVSQQGRHLLSPASRRCTPTSTSRSAHASQAAASSVVSIGASVITLGELRGHLGDRRDRRADLVVVRQGVLDGLVDRGAEVLDHVRVLVDELLRGERAPRSASSASSPSETDTSGNCRAGCLQDGDEGLGRDDRRRRARRRGPRPCWGTGSPRTRRSSRVHAGLVQRLHEREVGQLEQRCRRDLLAGEVLERLDVAALGDHDLDREGARVVAGDGDRGHGLDRHVVGAGGQQRRWVAPDEVGVAAHQRRHEGGGLDERDLEVDAVVLEDALLLGQHEGRDLSDGQAR